MTNFISGLTKLTMASILVVSLASCGGAEDRKLKYLEKGKTYLNEKNYAKAKVEIKNVLQIDPKFAEAYFVLGQIEERKKEIRKAVGQYKKALELDPTHTQAKVKLARIYVISGIKDLTDEAISLLDEVQKVEPDNIDVELSKATLEYRDGSKEKAIKSIENVVKKDTHQIEAITLLASIYIDQKDFGKTESLLLEAEKNNSEDVPIKIALAELYANDLNDIVKGEKFLLKAEKLDPENFKLKLGLAQFYGKTKQADKAEAILRKSIEQDDEDVQRYIFLIELLTMHGGLKKADEELVKYIASKPDFTQLKFVQAKFYKKFGKRDSAKKVLLSIIKDNEYDKEATEARTLLAKYLLEEGDKVESKKYADIVLSEYPTNNDALLINGKVALANLDSITAINDLRTVVKNSPKNAEATLLLAQAYVLNGENALAENELKKAIEFNPINDMTHANYARFLATQGRVDEAVDVIDKALNYFKASYTLMDIKLKILASQGKSDELIALLDIMEKNIPTKAEINLTKGKYYLAKKKPVLAIEQFERAYTKLTDKYAALKLIVNTYLSMGQSAKVFERLQGILDEDKDNAAANYFYGLALMSEKNIEKARLRFLQANKAAESWFPPYVSLASTYLYEKNSAKAIQVFQDASLKLKDKAPAQLQIAAIYESKKGFANAMSIYQQILSENSNHMLASNNYASLLLDHGVETDIPKALELSKGFEKVQQPALQDTLAWAYAKSGNSAKAVEILKPIVEKAPKTAIFRYHLGYALSQLGDKSAAKSHLEIAVSSKQSFIGKTEAEHLLKSL